MTLFITIALSLFAVYVAHFYWKVRKYPKGPFPWPFFGNLFQIPAENIQEYFHELSKTYGPCFTVWMPQPNVVLTDYEHIKDALVNKGDVFTWRSRVYPNTAFHDNKNLGIGMSNGDNWKIQRRMSLKILRDFGLGKNLMEDQVLRSTQEMLAQLKTMDQQKEVDVFWPIQLCVGNVINETFFGFHYSYTELETFKKFVETISTVFKLMRGKAVALMMMFPWLKHFPLVAENNQITKHLKEYEDFIRKKVMIQINKYDKDNEPENFVHAYYKEVNTAGIPSVNMENLVANVYDFWMAGMETTSNALRWHLAYMMKYPEIQERVRKEIIENIGTSRLPSMADKPNLPYTQAVIHEVQRHSNISPMLESHCALEDTEVLGHKIPANTNIFPQIWSVMRHDEVFDSPITFNPDRYLLPDGKTFNKAVLEKTIPFSIGKRNCIGEGLARMELFLISTALLQKYKFVATSEIDLTPNWAVGLTVKRYKCEMIPQF